MRVIEKEFSKYFSPFLYPTTELNTERTNIYHYTKVNSVMSILENKTLWLTKADFMNDSQEYIYAIEKIRDICFDNFDFNGKSMKKIFEHILRPNQFEYGAFIISFSKDYDSLPLWSYHSNMEGYNICFFSNDLYTSTQRSVELLLNQYLGQSNVRIGEDFNILIGDVIYEENMQDKVIMDVINRMNDVMDDYKSGSISKHYTDRILTVLTKRLQKYTVLFKQSSFNSERESRMIVTIEDKNILKRIIKHRISNGALIPYIEVNYTSIPIDSLTIGPRNGLDVAEKGLYSFLYHQGYNSEIKVNRSEIPLRF